MFFDSGNIISDYTFYAQSQIGDPLTKAERVYWKFGNFSTIIWLYA